MSAARLAGMPAIPLARGVPVITIATLRGSARGVLAGERCVVVFRALNTECALSEPFHDVAVAEKDLRVDLDDPQGFAYALRWLAFNSSGPIRDFTDAWFRDEVTDADRMALASACADVVKGGAR